MKLTKSALIKWGLRTSFCAIPSFIWGFGIGANIPAMLLGVATMILALALIESGPVYQAKRLQFPCFARAVDIGVRIRLWLTAVMGISWAVIFLSSYSGTLTVIAKTLSPLVFGEAFIGLFATKTVSYLTHLDLEELGQLASVDQVLATYLTTLLTALLHLTILGILISLIYVIVWLRRKNQQ